ncbi:hypothetical protein [Butyricimonas synergistica]|nr:hypothetical protein [Butyricimonas synergistica]
MDPAGALSTAATLPVNSVRRTLGTLQTFGPYGPYGPSTRTEGPTL